MNTLAMIVVVVVLGGALVVLQARLRRSRVARWVDEQGWTLVALRASLLPGPSWLSSYQIEIRDRTGHEVAGTAYATGFLRDKIWVDW